VLLSGFGKKAVHALSEHEQSDSKEPLNANIVTLFIRVFPVFGRKRRVFGHHRVSITLRLHYIAPAGELPMFFESKVNTPLWNIQILMLE
jgi:hypothetical protein